MRFSRMRCLAVALAALIPFAASVEGATPRNGRVTVPVMTPITIKLDQAVSLKTAANGTGFTASIQQPVEVDGAIVIPANASAGGLVSKDSPSGGQLELNSVFVNGRLYRITTSPVPFNQKGYFRTGSTITFQLVLSLNIAR